MPDPHDRHRQLHLPGPRCRRADYGEYLDQTPNSLTVNVNAVNDTPTLFNLSGDSVTYFEGGVPVRLDVGGDVDIDDIDSPDFAGGTLRIGGDRRCRAPRKIACYARNWKRKSTF